jgi:hypothetical protein
LACAALLQTMSLTTYEQEREARIVRNKQRLAPVLAAKEALNALVPAANERRMRPRKMRLPPPMRRHMSGVLPGSAAGPACDDVLRWLQAHSEQLPCDHMALVDFARKLREANVTTLPRLLATLRSVEQGQTELLHRWLANDMGVQSLPLRLALIHAAGQEDSRCE